MCSSPWNTLIYEEYCKWCVDGHVVHVDFYSDGTTISNYCIQYLRLIRVRFGNVHRHTETWFPVEISPTHTSIPSTLPDESRWHLKLQLLHRFLFSMFKSLMRVSYSGFVEKSSTFFPLLAIIIADHPGELSLLSLKRRDRDKLHALPFTVTYKRQTHTTPSSPSLSSSPSEDDRTQYRRRSSFRNNDGHLSLSFYPPRNIPVIIRSQLTATSQNQNRHLSGLSCPPHVSISYLTAYMTNLLLYHSSPVYFLTHTTYIES